ncbi:hypothetical protein ACS0TY_023112 [Phlomoides rotata]
MREEDGEGVAKAINEVIVGERGEGFRRRARELSERMKMEEDEAIYEEEIDEIAKGVELSEANFIWVIKFPVMEKIMSIEEALPQGFLDRGLVVSG